MTLGQVVRKYRKLRDMKQQVLAERIGMPSGQTYISDIEHDKGGIPTLDVLERLATALDAPLDEFVQTVVSNGSTHIPEIPEGLPPLLDRTIRRVRPFLTPDDWVRVAGYLDALAEERRQSIESGPKDNGNGKDTT